ncbi:uncharacterized protein LOC131302962 [Rhododendron vialii]|uniref:uncharacterized protein LOC131302962 n=1 Tax=Rhododendron vialii TaxID=182163 RepID=UPI00265ED169|nr:uncharacterized protein LOC131302962 [Rhododendron vialii]
MLAYPVILISRMEPLKYLFEKLALTSKLARWLLLLAEFEIKYVTRKSVKGRAVAKFLADRPIEGSEHMEFQFPPNEEVMETKDEAWTLYFDGVSNQNGFGIGILLASPEGSHIPLAFKLNFEVTNNEIEYEACIVGFEAALKIGVKVLEVIGDSHLVVSQANGDWRVKDEKMKQYHQELGDFIPRFEKGEIKASHDRTKDRRVYEYVMNIDEPDDGLPWYDNIWNFVEKGEFPAEATKKDRIALQRLASQYIICGGQLYRRSPMRGPHIMHSWK